MCLIGFAGWKDRDPEHSTLLSHSITATGHIMRGRAISSPQPDPSSDTHTHPHTQTHTHTITHTQTILYYGRQSNTFLAHPPACSLMPTLIHTHTHSHTNFRHGGYQKLYLFGLTVKTLSKLTHNGPHEEPAALKISVTERFILENSADFKLSVCSGGKVFGAVPVSWS